MLRSWIKMHFGRKLLMVRGWKITKVAGVYLADRGCLHMIDVSLASLILRIHRSY